MLAGLRRASLQRGLLAGSPPWLVIAGVLWAARAVRQATRSQSGVLWQGAVAEGEQLVVTYHPPRRRRRRR